MPTIFSDNGLKPTVLHKYGFKDIFDFMFFQFEATNFSIWDAFLEASYLNGRDFKIDIILTEAYNLFVTLNVGNNSFESFDGNIFTVEMREYHTNIAGTCYQIKSNIPMGLPNFVGLRLSFNKSLDMIDLPQVCNKYL